MVSHHTRLTELIDWVEESEDDNKKWVIFHCLCWYMQRSITIHQLLTQCDQIVQAQALWQGRLSKVSWSAD
jgi:hypothetical protein